MPGIAARLNLPSFNYLAKIARLTRSGGHRFYDWGSPQFASRMSASSTDAGRVCDRSRRTPLHTTT